MLFKNLFQTKLKNQRPEFGREMILVIKWGNQISSVELVAAVSDSILIIKDLTSFPTHPFCTNVSSSSEAFFFTSSYSHKISLLWFLYDFGMGSLTFRGSTHLSGGPGYLCDLSTASLFRKRKNSILMLKIRNENNISGKNVITWFSLCSHFRILVTFSSVL